jgi:hypothetical protein
MQYLRKLLKMKKSKGEAMMSEEPVQSRTWLWGFLRGACISATVAMILVLTYQRCIWCVVGIALFSGITMNCLPLMPLVFLMSLFVLAYHAIDYQKASIRVEVPLQDIVYVPTWDDISKYVKVANPLSGSSP